MLVLMRRPDQSIYVNGSARIMVLDVSGDKVRLGITADRSVEVHREEVLIESQEVRSRWPKALQPDVTAIAAEGVSSHA